MKIKTSRLPEYFVVFFVFSGFYFVLGIYLSFFGYDASRYYTVFLRVTLIFVMIMLLLTRGKAYFSSNADALAFLLLLFFFLLYCFNVLANFSDEAYRISKVDYVFYMLGYGFFPFLYFSFFDYKKNKDVFVKAILYGGVALGISSVYLYWDLFFSGISRISVIGREDESYAFLSPLALSYMAVLTISIALYAIGDREGLLFSRKQLILAILLLIPLLLLGASRGAFLVLITCFLAFLAFSSKKSKSSYTVTGLLVAVAIYLGASWTGSGLLDRFFGIYTDIEQGASSAIRIDIWRDGIALFMESPWRGGAIEVDGRYPHNIFIEIAMNTGLVGIFLFFPSLFWCFWRAVLIAKKGDLLVLLVLINGFVASNFSGSVNNSIVLYVGMGLALSSARSSN